MKIFDRSFFKPRGTSACLFFLIIQFFASFVFAEPLTDPDFGYSLDVPEGFQVAEYTPDGMSYRFYNQNVPVSLLLKIYLKDTASDSEAAFTRTVERLNGKADIDRLTWRNVPCVLSSFTMQIPGNQSEFEGWGASVPLPGKDAFLVLLCYTEKENFQALAQFIISTLNSLCIDKGSLASPGIFTCYAFPASQKIKKSADIGNTAVYTEFDRDDSEALQFVTELEFSVLKFYAENEKWKEAWMRYYRAIWRESSARLKKASNDIYSALYNQCKRENPENPMIRMNELLLEWVQYMPYKRDNQSAAATDFTDLVSTFCSEGSDCDSRSLLVSVLLQNMGLDTCLFISREYSHAVYGVNLAIPGAKIRVEDNDYLLCETTAKGIQPGLIDQTQSVTENWIPVLPRME